MKTLARALIAGAGVGCSILLADPAAALGGIEVPLASCTARNGTNTTTPPYGGPTPADWDAAGQLACFRWAAAHRPCGNCLFDGRLCSLVTSCEVLDMDPGYIGGGDGIPRLVAITGVDNLSSCATATWDAGVRGGLNCSCPPFAGFNADHRCYCNDGLVWDSAMRRCTVPDNCPGGIAEGLCLPGPVKPGKDCVDCPPRGDLTGGTNPINVATGMKFQSESYYRAATEHGLGIAAVFSSGTSTAGEAFRIGIFGRNRTSAFDRNIRDLGTLSGFAYVVATRPDGRRLDFRRLPNASALTPDPDIADRLERVFNSLGQWAGYRYTAADGDLIEMYTAGGVFLFDEDRQKRRRWHTYADGNGGAASGYAGSDALGYVAPTCAPPEGWVYRIGAAGGDAGALPAGKLMCATDPFGRQLHFQYDERGRVTRIVDPAGGIYRFSYDGASGGCDNSLENPACSAGNLTSVTFPDQRTRVYHYNEPDKVNDGMGCAGKPAFSPGRAHLANHLTGLVDENAERYATWTYDCEGRALSSEHAGGAERIAIAYDSPLPGQSTVTDYRIDAGIANQSRVYGFAVSHGVSRNTALSEPNDRNAAFARYTYDGNGNIAARTDWNGNRTNFNYDLTRNLQTSRVEGLTASGGATPQTRTITTEWHASFRLPARIAEPLRITSFAYDGDGSRCGARGALCGKTIQPTADADGAQGLSAASTGAARAWAYSYDANGNVLTMDGPRTDVADVTTYSYYARDDPEPGKRGNLATIRNAAGQVTSITAYDAHGQPTGIVDANGTATTLTYDARQRLLSRSVGGETTRYDYDAVGQLTRLALPDSSFLLYSHDAARRLRSIEDNLGNRINYALDLMGHRTHEEVRDAADHPVQRRARVYGALGRLFRDLGAENQTTEYTYDDQGNIIVIKDPLSRLTSNKYDALNRLSRIIDPALGVTQYAYDGLDAVTSVIDPRGLVTTYEVDGLGNLLRRDSPDTGTTLNTYDAAGNLLTQTDAKAQLTRYSYDVLNRVRSIVLHDGSTQSFVYDEGPNGLGRLSGITERNGAGDITSQVAYVHDPHGRVASETRSVNGVQYTVSYAYDTAGRLVGITYPGGRSVHFTLDTLGRVAEVGTTKDGQSQVVVQGVAYHPFGGVKSYVLGNGQSYSRAIDLDGRVASYSLGGQSFRIGYDAAGRIGSISGPGDAAQAVAFGYDELDRLISAVAPGSAYGYSYDAVGNRRKRTAGAGTDIYEYSPSANRLLSIAAGSAARSFTYDANGSTTADGNSNYSYDARGRMVRAVSSLGATAYQVNALGQRVRKTNSIADTVFHYDVGGRLIAETDASGSIKREYMYLGDIPVGVIQ